LDELELIEEIRRRFGTEASDRIKKGIGDDAAVLLPSRGLLLLTTDIMVENLHFDLSFMSPRDIGFKLVARNVSDIFAMAGEPEFMLLDLCLPQQLLLSHQKRTVHEFVEALFDGIEEGLKRYSVILIGGDLSTSPGKIYLSATLTGSSERPVFRSGARPGDLIYVTGTLGDSSCGLEILKRTITSRGGEVTVVKDTEIPSEIKKPLLKKALSPEPEPVHKKINKINAMIDISDGLAIDLWRLCRESAVGAVIYQDKIPISKEVREASRLLGLDPLSFALSGGEDYELLFTTENRVKEEGITEIGFIKEGDNLSIIDGSGIERPLKPEGYIHRWGQK